MEAEVGFGTLASHQLSTHDEYMKTQRRVLMCSRECVLWLMRTTWLVVRVARRGSEPPRRSKVLQTNKCHFAVFCFSQSSKYDPGFTKSISNALFTVVQELGDAAESTRSGLVSYHQNDRLSLSDSIHTGPISSPLNNTRELLIYPMLYLAKRNQNLA